MAASSLWRQLCWTAEGQEKSESSVPVQPRSSRWMGPVPGPNVLDGPGIAVLSVIQREEIKSEFIILIAMLHSYSGYNAQINTVCICTLQDQPINHLLVPEKPACLHATLASFTSQRSSQTVPQAWFWQTSTRPSHGTLPPTNLMEPLTQPGN